jgi:hypothetical protein
MLQKQVSQIVFAQGVDTKTNPRVLPAGKLLLLENALFTKPGRIEKRPGFEALRTDISGSSEQITSGKAVLAFQDELLEVSDSKLYSYSESATAWLDRGYISAISVQSETVIRNTATQSHPDVGLSQNVALFAWEDSRGGIRATAIDLETGLPVISDALISATGARPRVSGTTSNLFVHYMDASNTFKVRTLNPLDPGAGFTAALTLASDANGTNPNFDIFPFGNVLIFAYNTTGNQVIAGYLKADGDIGTSVSGEPDPLTININGGGALAIVGRFEGDANDQIYVFIHNTSDGLQCVLCSNDLVDTSTVLVDSITTQVNQITGLVQESKARVFYEVNAAATYNRRVKCDAVNIDGTVDSGGTGNEFLRSVGLASKAFEGEDGNAHVVCIHDSTFQPTYFTVRRIDDTRGFIANTIAKDEAGGLHSKRSQLSSVILSDDGLFIVPTLLKTRLVSEQGAVFGIVGVQRTELDFNDLGLFIYKEFAKNLHIAGGVLQNYDGTSVTEHGFFLFPEDISNAITTTTGTLEAGDRQYCVVYEWTDNQGNRHQSAPSLPLDVTNALNDKNTLTIPTLRVTEKKGAAGRSEVSIVVYRTTVSGEIFYRISSISAPTENDVDLDSVTFEDNTPDTGIESNEILYITGGVLDNIQPKSSKIVTEYNDRLALGDEDPDVVQYSKKRVFSQGMAFSDSFKFRADQGGQGIFGLSRLDDKFIIFKPEKLLVQAGQGPEPTGINNDFQTPQALPSDVGSETPRSIVEYPEGLIFKSKKGWYQLSRGLSTEYIGAPVEQYNDLTVSGAVLISDQNRVVFLHQDGPALVYDYLVGQWDTFTAHECLGGVSWKGRLCILKSDGTVWREKRDTYLDAGSTQDLLAKTSWIQLAGLNGYQRLYRIMIDAEKKSSHAVVIKIAYDMDEAVKEQFIFDPDEVLGDTYYGDGSYGEAAYYGGADSKYTIEICPKIQKCRSFQLTIQEINPDGVDGQGVIFTGFAVQYGVKAGLYKASSLKRAIPS